METEEFLKAIGKAAETIASPNYADKLALVLSLIAILCATGVAIFQVRISNQQNKIALFEKRYKVYDTARICVSASKKVAEFAKDLDDVYDIFCTVFHDWPHMKTNDDTDKRWVFQFFEIAEKLEESEFLYDKEIYQRIQTLNAFLLVLVGTTYLKEEERDFQRRKEHFCRAAEDIISNHVLEKMRKELQLQPIKIKR